MDIRRIPLWQSRNATYMSNNLVRAVIEDQGEVAIELSARSVQGGFVNALSLPYFRGRGAGVLGDPNTDWWKGKESFYQAGGSYFTFPSKDEDGILTTNTYWTVRRYGSDGKCGGLWRLSEMKSRMEHMRYSARKVDLLLPGEPVLYSLVHIENRQDEMLEYNASIHSMLTPPFLESGCFLATSASHYVAFSPNFREVAFNRLKSGIRFNELRHAPAINGSVMDAGYVPGPTGSYDYLAGQLSSGDELGWTVVFNPRLQLLFMTLVPGPGSSLPGNVVKCPHVDIACNYLGRMDTPWALYEGGTPQVFSLTVGSGMLDHHGALDGPEHYSLAPGEGIDFISAQAYTSYDNPRMSNGFYSLEKVDAGFVFKRTKSYAFVPCDPSFSALRELAARLFQNSQE